MLRALLHLMPPVRIAAVALLLLGAPVAAQTSLQSDYSALWSAQPKLVAQAVATLPASRKHAPQVFTVSIAAGGSQAIFGREAEAMRALFQHRLGKNAPSLLLSNALAHQSLAPFANRDNVSAALSAIGQRYNPGTDLAVIYLTAHGAPDASVQTDLPNRFGLKWIDAEFLASALNKSGITRRIIVISACFSGSWIDKLASPDTIVLTAAAANRTSFGCDDSREYTFFGTAWLTGTLGTGSSWHMAFDRLKTDIGAAEEQYGVQPSLPTASIGARMGKVWDAPLGPVAGH